MSILKDEYIERNSIENISISVFKKPILIDLLLKRYGKNYMKPSK